MAGFRRRRKNSTNPTWANQDQYRRLRSRPTWRSALEKRGAAPVATAFDFRAERPAGKAAAPATACRPGDRDRRRASYCPQAKHCRQPRPQARARCADEPILPEPPRELARSRPRSAYAASLQRRSEAVHACLSPRVALPRTIVLVMFPLVNGLVVGNKES